MPDFLHAALGGLMVLEHVSGGGVCGGKNVQFCP